MVGSCSGKNRFSRVQYVETTNTIPTRHIVTGESISITCFCRMHSVEKYSSLMVQPLQQYVSHSPAIYGTAGRYGLFRSFACVERRVQSKNTKLPAINPRRISQHVPEPPQRLKGKGSTQSAPSVVVRFDENRRVRT